MKCALTDAEFKPTAISLVKREVQLVSILLTCNKVLVIELYLLHRLPCLSFIVNVTAVYWSQFICSIPFKIYDIVSP